MKRMIFCMILSLGISLQAMDAPTPAPVVASEKLPEELLQQLILIITQIAEAAKEYKGFFGVQEALINLTRLSKKNIKFKRFIHNNAPESIDFILESLSNQFGPSQIFIARYFRKIMPIFAKWLQQKNIKIERFKALDKQVHQLLGNLVRKRRFQELPDEEITKMILNIKELLAKGALPSQPKLFNVIVVSSRILDTDHKINIITMFLNAGANPNLTSHFKKGQWEGKLSLLEGATLKGNRKLIKLLLEYGAIPKFDVLKSYIQYLPGPTSDNISKLIKKIESKSKQK